MREYLIAGVALAAAFTVLPAMGKPGTESEKPLTISSFSAIEASAGMDVIFSPGAPSAKLVGDAKEFEQVEVKVENNVLKVTRKSRGWGIRGGWNGQVRVVVTGPAALSAIAASSGADVAASGVATDRLALNSSSGADIDVSGTCRTLAASASSGSDINAKELACEDVAAQASSGADAVVYASKTLSASASSGGDVTHYGPAAATSVSESSGGDVTRAG
jgi:hypothetical protein